MIPISQSRADPSRFGRVPVLLAMVGLVLVGATGPETIQANLARLRSMPLEQRQALDEQLRRFEQLDRSTQESVRELDRQLAVLPAEEQQRHLAIMRRYSQWLQSLEPAHREELHAADPARRIELIRQYQAEVRSRPTPNLDQIWFGSATFNPLTLVRTAHAIRVWVELSTEEQAKINTMRSPWERLARLEQIGTDREIERNVLPLQEIQRRYRNRIPGGRPLNLNDPDLWEAPGPQAFGPLAARKSQRQLAQWKLNALRNLETALVREYRTSRPPIPSESLRRFDAALPDWLREPIDPLPPDAARLRLSILYHLALGDDPMPESTRPDRRPSRPPISPSEPPPSLTPF